METLALNIAQKIGFQMTYDEDKQSVIAYGLTAIFQMSTIFVVISILGVIFDFWYESIIIFLEVGLIRKSTGGAHSQTMKGCLTISVLSILLLSSLSRYLLSPFTNGFVNYGCSIIVFAICCIVFYLRVPVDSPNKPIVRPEKIRRLRRQSFWILTILILISITFISIASWFPRFYSLAMSIRLALLWQLLTLTSLGARILGKIDIKLSTILTKE
jgi:accessory gene regulator B